MGRRCSRFFRCPSIIGAELDCRVRPEHIQGAPYQADITTSIKLVAAPYETPGSAQTLQRRPAKFTQRPHQQPQAKALPPGELAGADLRAVTQPTAPEISGAIKAPSGPDGPSLSATSAGCSPRHRVPHAAHRQVVPVASTGPCGYPTSNAQSPVPPPAAA